jgi:hypothetical protein
MVQQPSWLLRILVVVLLICGWGIAIFLSVRALERLRCLQGWAHFLDGIPTVPCQRWEGSTSLFSPIELPHFTTPRRESRVIATARPVQPTLRPTHTAPPTSLPLLEVLPVITARPTQPMTQAAPPAVLQCRNSLPTRLRVGAIGRTHHEFYVRLRNAPAGESAVRLAPNTRFEVIGAAHCAELGRHELMWWQVRLTSGSARGQVGWIAESGLNDSGRMLYNLFPN